MSAVTFYMADDEPRPAFILRENGPDNANLAVLVDGLNDDQYHEQLGTGQGTSCARWVTSAPRYSGSGPRAGTWEPDLSKNDGGVAGDRYETAADTEEPTASGSTVETVAEGESATEPG